MIFVIDKIERVLDGKQFSTTFNPSKDNVHCCDEFKKADIGPLSWDSVGEYDYDEYGDRIDVKVWVACPYCGTPIICKRGKHFRETGKTKYKTSEKVVKVRTNLGVDWNMEEIDSE